MIDQLFKKNIEIGNKLYGKIFLVNNKNTNEEVILKEIKKFYIDKTNFENEWKKLKKIKNENTIQYLNKYEDNDNYYITIEKCDKNLFDYVNEKGKLNLDEIKNIIFQLNNAFKLLSDLNIMHLMIKPSNILIKYKNKYNSGNNYTIKLSDFENFKLSNYSGKISTTNTQGFMSPEIKNLLNNNNNKNIEEKLKYNSKYDLWSIGVLIYYLYFNETHEFDLMHGDIPNIDTIKDYNLKDLLLKLININPDNRLDWKEYFKHPFIMEVNKNYNNNIINIELEIEIFGKNKELNEDEIEYNYINDYKIANLNKNINILYNKNKEDGKKKSNNVFNGTEDQSIQIFINGKLYPFLYSYKFENEGVYNINIKGNGKLNINSMFYGCQYIKKIRFNSFYFDDIIDMSYMFYGCSSLIEIDISVLNTSKVINMEGMFSHCKNLILLDLGTFNTNKVKNMKDMFSYCENLIDLNISSFNTINVKTMKFMFSNCKNLITLNLEKFNTTSVENFEYMFWNCENLTSLNLSSFNTLKANDSLEMMFSGCKKLSYLNISNFNTSKVKNMEYMFSHCENLTTLDLSSFNTSKVKSMEMMFSYCKNLNNLNLSSFNTSQLINIKNIFFACFNLKILDLSSFNINKIEKINGIFKLCDNLETLLGNRLNYEKFNNEIKKNGLKTKIKIIK